MAEITEFDELESFARETSRKVVKEEIPYPLSGIGKIRQYKRFAYTPYDSERNIFFVWFSDPLKKIGGPTTFSGAFTTLPFNIKASVKIRSRNFLDKFSIFSKGSSAKLGVQYFDSEVVISGDIDTDVKKLLLNSPLQRALISGIEQSSSTIISINEMSLDFIPEF